MLISLLLIIYNISIAFLAGIAGTLALSRVLKLTYVSLHPTILVLLGWLYMVLVLQVWHFFWPINFAAHLFIWMLIALSVVGQRKSFLKEAVASIHFLFTKYHLFVGLTVLFTLLLNICSRTADGDIGDYHLQAIKWMENYAVVPGIGNIRRQLGNNSNWFLLNAFSGLHFTGLQSVYTLNASLILMVVLYLVPHIKQPFWLRNFVLTIYFLIAATRKYSGAVTNDVVITSSIAIVFCWFMDWIAQPAKNNYHLLLVVMLAMSMVTYKLSALPMGLFAALVVVFFYQKVFRSMRIFTWLILFSIALFLPWFITNVIHSGYLVFPILGTNFFGVDWEMRSSIVAFEVYANLAYARAPMIDIEVARYFTFEQWWPYWIQSIDAMSKGLLITTGLILIGLPIMLSFNKKMRDDFIRDKYWIIYFTIVVAMILWFTHGPTPRFVFGYMVFTASAALSIIHWPWLNNVVFRIKYYALLLAAIGLLFLFSMQWLPRVLNGQSWLMPPPFPQSEMHSFKVSNGRLNVPAEHQQCWDGPLPCTNLPDSLLEYRGNELGAGFRIKPHQ